MSAASSPTRPTSIAPSASSLSGTPAVRSGPSGAPPAAISGGQKFGERALGHNPHQLGAELGRGGQIAIEPTGIQRGSLERRGLETAAKSLLGRAPAEGARPSSGDRHANAAIALGNEHPDQGIARGRMGELAVAGAAR